MMSLQESLGQDLGPAGSINPAVRLMGRVASPVTSQCPEETARAPFTRLQGLVFEGL